MNGLRSAGALGLLALVSLLHLQWVAACDVVPRNDNRACCTTAGAGGNGHCDHESSARSCVSPFAKTAGTVKVPDRAGHTGVDPPEQASCLIPSDLSKLSAPAGARTSPPAYPVARDGRCLYLTSSRLRL